MACRLFPNQGSNPHPLQWKQGVLTTGLSRNYCREAFNASALPEESNLSLTVQAIRYLALTCLVLSLAILTSLPTLSPLNTQFSGYT